jgi:hypothetical protein
MRCYLLLELCVKKLNTWIRVHAQW